MKEHSKFSLGKYQLADYTLFIDRDGVINEPIVDYYACKPEDLIFCDGAIQSLKELSFIFKYVVLVTNQQGVGKGVMTAVDLENVHLKLYNALKSSGSPNFSAAFYAPYLKSDTHKWRKPSNGMLLKALSYYEDIDFNKAIMIGDSPGDMELADTLRISKIRISNPQFSFENQDYTYQSLASFVAAL